MELHTHLNEILGVTWRELGNERFEHHFALTLGLIKVDALLKLAGVEEIPKLWVI